MNSNPCRKSLASREFPSLIIGSDSSLERFNLDDNVRLIPDSVTIISSWEGYFSPVSQDLLPAAQNGIKCSGISPYLISLWDTRRVRSSILSTPLSIKRVVITSEQLLDGVPTSRRAPGTNLNICKMLSTRVTVFPEPGDPKITLVKSSSGSVIFLSYI
ncbi:hypothetical protein GQX74_014705 [Glossina fuscipes]|nr:hypothetical protein GQX74_014705 [Glossina fuscipes]